MSRQTCKTSLIRSYLPCVPEHVRILINSCLAGIKSISTHQNRILKKKKEQGSVQGNIAVLERKINRLTFYSTPPNFKLFCCHFILCHLQHPFQSHVLSAKEVACFWCCHVLRFAFIVVLRSGSRCEMHCGSGTGWLR